MTDYLHDAMSIARGAGKIILGFYSREYSVHEKENKTPVTEADIAADKFIIGELRKRYEYPILTEESKDDLSRLDSPFLWIVDPLDGTASFIDKNGEFAVHIGLIRHKQPVMGVVYDPLNGVMFYAERGKGAFVQRGKTAPRRIHVSGQTRVDDMVLIVPVSKRRGMSMVIADQLGIKNIVSAGGLGIRTTRIAEGKADAFILISAYTSAWDTGPSQIILDEAGGRMTDAYGRPLRYNEVEVLNKHGVVASNGVLHERIIEKIRPFLTI